MEWREQLGRRIRAERERQRYSVKSAAEAALVARDTWAKIEAGKSVHDANLRAALMLLDLDEHGEPAVSPTPTEAWAESGKGLSVLHHALSGAIELGTLSAGIDPSLRRPGDQLILDATDLYRAARRILDEREGGDGNADSTLPGGSAPTSEALSEVDDELPAAAKEGVVEDAGENSI